MPFARHLGWDGWGVGDWRMECVADSLIETGRGRYV